MCQSIPLKVFNTNKRHFNTPFLALVSPYLLSQKTWKSDKPFILSFVFTMQA
jgi:hypothetical protein